MVHVYNFEDVDIGNFKQNYIPMPRIHRPTPVHSFGSHSKRYVHSSCQSYYNHHCIMLLGEKMSKLTAMHSISYFYYFACATFHQNIEIVTSARGLGSKTWTGQMLFLLITLQIISQNNIWMVKSLIFDEVFILYT